MLISIPDQQLIINDPLDLVGYGVVERNLLTELESHRLYQQKIGQFYRALVAKHNLEYRQYQIDNAATICTRNRHILTHALGSGKTFVSLLAAVGVYSHDHNRRPGTIHITVPNLLSAQRWIEELDRINSVDKFSVRFNYAVIKTEADLYKTDACVFIYNHDFPKRRVKGSNKTLSKILGRRFRPSYIVIDEAHNLQSNSDRSNCLEYVTKRAKRRVALTGTLSELPHIHHLSNLIYGAYFPYRNLSSFSKRFSTKSRLQTNYLGKVGENAPERYLQKLDRLKAPEYYELMRRYIHRVRIDDPNVINCVTIPINNVHIHAVEPTLEQLEEHEAYIKIYKNNLKLAAQKKSAESLRLIGPLISVANNPLEKSNKLSKLVELVTNSPGKVIVFCSYITSSRLATEVLKEVFGDTAVIRLYSQDLAVKPEKLTFEQRVDLVNQFQYNPAVKVGVFSINLTAESIDLTAASDVIYYCLPWSSIKIQQSLSRAVRPGNRHKEVNTHYLLTKGLIDEHQVVLATEKIKGSKLLMDYELGQDVTEQDLQDLSPAQAIRKLLAG